jgi:hypothetical protein
MKVEITFPVWHGLKQQTAVIEFDEAAHRQEIAEAVGDKAGWEAERERQLAIAEILKAGMSVTVIR